MVSEKTKHIDLKWQFLKDHVEVGTLKLRFLPMDRMVADTFTNSMQGHTLSRYKNAIMGGAEPMQRFTP
jgi:hypothetical protein